MYLSPFNSNSIVPIIIPNSLRRIYFDKDLCMLPYFTRCYYIITKTLFIEIFSKLNLKIVYIHYDKYTWHICKLCHLTKKFSVEKSSYKNKYSNLPLKICDIILDANFSSVYKNKIYKN